MGLNRIQKHFIHLAIGQRKKIGIPRNARRKRMGKNWWVVSPKKSVKVKIINAITGESTTALSYDDSVRELKKWLKLRNLRAQFAQMVIPKNSTWNKLSAEAFNDYPVIVKVGNYQTPYVIDRVGDKLTVGKKTTMTLFLKIVDNIDYLSLISEKRKIVENLPKPVKITEVKQKVKPEPKRKKKDSYLDDYDGWE